MAADTTLSEPTGRRPDRPALRSDPASEQRARDVMGSALGVVAPSAVPLRDGSIRLTTADDVLPARIVERIHERLTRRAADHANEHRMLGEAVALLGDSVCRARGGPSPVDAATGALDTLLDVPGLPPESRTEAEALLRRILQADPERATGPEPSPRATDVAREARAIGREARELGTAAARTGPAAEQRRTTEGRHAGAHRRTEAGRTVGAPRVAGTGFVAGGRPADDPDLTAAEALRALTRVRRDDLGGTLTADPAALAGPGLAAVDSATLGRQHFQVRISPPGRRRVAATEVRAGTVSDPHVLRISPRLADAQLARVWVHAISHTLQEVQAVRAGRDAGFLAKAWAVVTRKGRDRLVTAQYDEYRMLARDWRDAHAAGLPTENLERDLRGLSIAIARRGHPEPAPPWAPGALAVTPAPSAVAGPDARQGPAPNTLPHLRSRVSAQVTVLDSAVADLRQRAEAKDETAAEAGVLAADKRGEAGAERELRDRAAPERARKLDAEAVAAEDKQRRHTELAGSYRYAAALAERARDAYKDVLAEAETVATDPGCSTARLVELTDAAGRRAEEYRRSVVAALPPRDALHTGTPTGRLPHLTALTERINATLAAHDVAYRFTPELLHRTLRAEFR
ncbi:MAG TPA: hypothetical protein VEK80_05720, partial [Kribbellaceae bacterium]|nr:hypothetical protein [Kribbellaceae bacterium]